jgi:fucose permease
MSLDPQHPLAQSCATASSTPCSAAQAQTGSTTQALAPALWSIRAQFAALGLISGVWGVHIPSIKAHYGLGEAALSLVLLTMALGAVLSLLGAGRVIARLGVRRATVLAAALMGAMLALALQWPTLGWMLPSMLLLGAAMSLFDVAINTEGSALESLAGRAVMSNLHGSFSLGGMVGAALGALLLRWQWPPELQLAGVGLLIAGAVGLAARGMLEQHPPETAGADGANEAEPARFVWPRGQLLLLGLLIFAAMSAEGAMYDWSVLYLTQEVLLPQDQAALGYAAFAGAMAVARLLGDRLRDRYPEALLLRAGSLLTAVAMSLVLLSGLAWVALLGYAVIGAGLALSAPILYNASTRVPGTTRAAAIAAVTSVGYSGFLLGPPLIGTLAQGFGLSWALGVVVLASLLLAWGARLLPRR